MDTIEKFSKYFTDEFVPLIKWEVELAYVVFMVQMAISSADKKWHKQNIFYSYLRALLFVKGADIISALCMGDSPMAVISTNCILGEVALIWWLLLFIPLDICNKILHVEVGDVKPILIVVSSLATLRQILAVNSAVAMSLKTYPGSYIAVLVGTLAGNGCLAVASVFGDFAKMISTPKSTKVAFVTALALTVTEILCPKSVSAVVVLTCCACVLLTLQLLEEFGHNVEVFHPIYELIRKIVVTCDLVDHH